MRRGPGFPWKFFFQLFELGAQVLELLHRGEQLLELLLVGLGPALLVGVVGRLLVFLEDVAQIGFAGLDPVAQVDEKIQRDRRLEDLFFDLLLAGLDALGDLDFLLPREQLEVAHLLEVEPYRVGRVAAIRVAAAGGALGLGFLGLGFLGVSVSLGGPHRGP